MQGTSLWNHALRRRFSLFMFLLPFVHATHPEISAASLAHSTCSKIYIAKQGDTCSSMASAANLTTNAFLRINPVLNCSSVKVGELICFAPCSGHAARERKAGLLADYIGAIGTPINLSDVPIKNDLYQFLILSFAIDANASAVPQNGKFTPYWVSSITPESVAAVKSAHPNLRVLMSLAGYSMYVAATGATQVIKWYDPEDPKAWLKNALESIGSLVEEYHLDGIDIDYETFPESKTFAKLIGTLIKTLKRQNRINIATMAPFESVVPYYRKLYGRYHRHFNYVNYQFYANNFSTASEYTKAYDEVSKIFPRSKLLASLQVVPGSNGPTADVFFEAFKKLEKQAGSVPGLFLWAADYSKLEGFLVEKVAECILKK